MIIIIIVIIITITTVMIMVKKEIQKNSTANSSFCLRQLYSWWVALNTMTNLGAYYTEYASRSSYKIHRLVNKNL